MQVETISVTRDTNRSESVDKLFRLVAIINDNKLFVVAHLAQ